MTKDPKEIFIAGNLKISDWEKLKPNLICEIDDNWIDAFDFFERRIYFRYIRPIQVIQCLLSNKGEGFAIVNLQCSLIETIESFYNGWIFKYPDGYYLREIRGKPISGVKNKDIFIEFFKKRDPFNGEIDGFDFYLNVRCGLLHETQTKNGWRILGKHHNSGTFYDQDENDKIIYRTNFQEVINKVIENYKMAIIKGKPYGLIPVAELRANFVAKIDHICELSKPKS